MRSTDNLGYQLLFLKYTACRNSTRKVSEPTERIFRLSEILSITTRRNVFPARGHIGSDKRWVCSPLAP